ncbi:MAG: glycosyltransferase family 39 protein [Chloroflexi bacterium]|nr:glycosyltransferase family 39 protein [Chloroflexota bacterium]
MDEQGPPPAAPAARRTPRGLQGSWDLFLLIAVLAVAAALRLNGFDWDAGTHQHPDERFLTDVASKVQIPGSFGEYFNTPRSPLNPYQRGYQQYAYGQLPLTLTRAVGEALGMTRFDNVYLVGRGLSAFADIGTVVFAWLIGRRLFDRRVGLLAAVLLAVAVLPIQLAHFFAVDTFATFFAAGSVFFAQRAIDRDRLSDAAVAGVFAGLAMGSKVSAAALLPVLLVGFMWPRLAGRRWTARTLTNAVVDGGTPWAVAVLAAFVAFRLAEPYAFAGPSLWSLRLSSQWITDKAFWASVSAGGVDVPYMIQWNGTPPLLYVLGGIVQWGLGPLLGLTALAGTLIAAARLPFGGPAVARTALLATWVVANLVYFGFQFAKFMRYLEPIYFGLAVFAAWLLVRLIDYAPRPRLRQVAMGFASLVVLFAVGWAIAFQTVYLQPHSRIQASDWIYANIPAGKTLATEHWDDRLPLTLPGGRDGNRYRYTELTLYDAEVPAKREKLYQVLDQSDYIVLASRRLVDSIPRLPQRYPLAIAYYQALFAGELGYERINLTRVTPSLGPLQIDDSRAQEDFTVYDHPTVEVWAKRADYNPAQVREILGAVALPSNVAPRAAETPGGQNGLLLTSEQRASAERAGTWSDLFDRDGIVNQAPLPVWLLAWEALALLSVPLLWRTLHGLPDRGYGASKIVGLAVVAYGVWLLASLRIAPFGQLSILAVAVLLLGAPSAVVVVRQGGAFRGWLRREWRLIATVEMVFLVGFALATALRAANPDLWHPAFGGEKPMNFAYLNAIVKSDYFPPYDPWFAGGYINYYYFGGVLVGTIVKLTGIEPQIAFNLAQPGVYGAFAAGVFSLGFALLAPLRGAVGRSGAYLAGAASVTLVAVLGNLDGGVQILEQLQKLGSQANPASSPLVKVWLGLVAIASGQARLQPLDFWRSTRFIGPEEPGPIHEFPYFTFLYGDMHAHQVALPLAVAALLVAFHLAGGRGRHRAGARLGASPWRSARGWLRWLDVRALGLAALLIGLLRATNTWDFPTYAAVIVAAIGLACLRVAARSWWRGLLRFLATAGGTLALSQVLIWPYLQNYQLFYNGVDPSPARTAFSQYLQIWGLPVFLVASLLGVIAARRLRGSRRAVREAPPALVAQPGYYGIVLPVPMALQERLRTPAGALGGLGILVGLVWLALGYPTRAFEAVGIGAGLALMAAHWRQPRTAFLGGLIAASFGVMLIPELVALQGDIGRMNTVFKFYYQAWLMLGVAAGAALAWLVREGVRGRDHLVRSWRWAWAVPLVLLVAAAAAYPLWATESKTSLRFAAIGPGLDGMAYMDQARYSDRDQDLNLPGDAQAIRWLQDTIQGSPVLLEGRAAIYRWGARVSIYTGLPTVLGWDWHQQQQRVAYAAQIQERASDVQRAYDSPQPADLLSTIKKYNVRWVYVGGLERAYYSPAGLAKLQRMPELRLAYDAAGVQIYEVMA